MVGKNNLDSIYQWGNLDTITLGTPFLLQFYSQFAEVINYELRTLVNLFFPIKIINKKLLATNSSNTQIKFSRIRFIFSL